MLSLNVTSKIGNIEGKSSDDWGQKVTGSTFHQIVLMAREKSFELQTSKSFSGTCVQQNPTNLTNNVSSFRNCD